MQISDMLDSVDAAVFSGDLLEDELARGELEAYIERWTRAIEKHNEVIKEINHD
jgi:hypothetical protein